MFKCLIGVKAQILKDVEEELNDIWRILGFLQLEGALREQSFLPENYL